ncbi:MAG: hypothetical protein RLZZ458_1938, partial [Planctomycetota bacterium]
VLGICEESMSMKSGNVRRLLMCCVDGCGGVNKRLMGVKKGLSLWSVWGGGEGGGRTRMSVLRQKVGRTSKSVNNPEKPRGFATSELSGIHGNGFESTFAVRVKDVRPTGARRTRMSVLREKVGRTSKSVNNPEKPRGFATSELCRNPRKWL